MTFKKFISTNNMSIIIAIIIITFLAVFFYMGSQGFFKSPIGEKITNTKIIERLEEKYVYSSQCSLSFFPLAIFVGDEITGIIQDGKNTLCNVYATDGIEWYLVYSGTTDNDGRLSSTQKIDVEGTFIFRAICDECITNEVTIYSNPIIEEDVDIETFCSRRGYDWAIDKVDYAECRDEAYNTCKLYNKNYEFNYFLSEEWCCYKCTEDLPESPEDYCNDDDGGLNYNTKGRCQSLKDGLFKDYTDNCPSYFKINEVSCINEECAITLYECLSGQCVNGACVPLSDTDGDGFSDQEEEQAGTNPNDPNSYPGGPLEQCADACKDLNYAGATLISSGDDNSCMGYGYAHCFPDFGLQYESSEFIEGTNCCCFNCQGW